jgi:hypothetical protein
VKRAQLAGQDYGLKRRLGPLGDNAWSDWLPVYAFAVEHPEGIILVDTGSNAGLMNLPRWHPYFHFAVRFDINCEEEAGIQLAKLGIAPREAATVLIAGDGRRASDRLFAGP